MKVLAGVMLIHLVIIVVNCALVWNWMVLKLLPERHVKLFLPMSRFFVVPIPIIGKVPLLRCVETAG